jgi:hypothetical protein
MTTVRRGLGLLLGRLMFFGLAGLLIGGGLTWLGPPVVDHLAGWRVVQWLVLDMPAWIVRYGLK